VSGLAQRAASVAAVQDAIDEGDIVAGLPESVADLRYQSKPEPLAAWFQALRESPATAKIAVVGDSTRDVAAAGVGFHNRLKYHIAGLRGLEGMDVTNVLNHAYNGASLAAITASIAWRDALTAAAPQLILATGLINDERASTHTVDQLEVILRAWVDQRRALSPGVPIVLSIPNTFLTTDVGANGYVVPNGDAQAKSTRIRQAYLRLVDAYPDVLVQDTQERIFGVTARAASSLMADQIHPGGSGMNAIVDDLVDRFIGRKTPWSSGQAAIARAAQPFTPWLDYGREVEDEERYVLIAEGSFANQAIGSFTEFVYPSGRRSRLQRNDLVELPDGQTYRARGSFGTGANDAAQTRILSADVVASAVKRGRSASGGSGMAATA
jgi:lysophospholipase L1-like esterase